MTRFITSRMRPLVAGTLAVVVVACGPQAAAPGATPAPTSAVSVPASTTIPMNVPTTAIATALPAPATAAPAPATAVPVPNAELPQQFDVKLRGNVGTASAQMYLRRDGTALTGQYFYEQVRDDSGFEQYLELSGPIKPDGSFSLQESDINGIIGVFRASLVRGESGALEFNGTWTASAGGRIFPAQFTELRLLPGAYTLTDKRVEENDEANKATYAATYPQLNGAGAAGDAFNQLVAGLVTKDLDAFKAGVASMPSTEAPGQNTSSIDISYEITVADDAVISVLFHEYTYMAGAAHPNSTTFTVNYDLANNRPLTLADLFKPDSEYLSFLSNYSLEKLRTRDTTLFEEGAAPKQENFRSWNIVDQGLQITFDPYQVAAYAAGPQVIYIPFVKMGDALNTVGVVGRFVPQ